MNNLPPDEQKLLDFLRQYRPLPPEANPDLESQIMAKIEHESVKKSSSYGKIIFGAIATLLFLTWGGLQIRNFRAETALKNQENAELEAFLIDSWEGTLFLDEPDSKANLESNWLFLTENEDK